jgi:hypothetical protein
MSDRDPLSPELRSLIERERLLPSVPAPQRARAMARARAALAAGGASATAPTRARPGKRWAAAAAALLASAAIGAAAYEIRARLAQPPHVAPPAPPPAPVVASATAAPTTEIKAVAEPPAPEPQVVAPALSRADAARAELRLLRAARAAVARRDFAGALAPIAEHTRKFKNGRLAEEREALRVKALSGLGRTEEARRAAAAFRARFPRSVLLPAVSRMPASEP